jgi:glyoxalase family protein
VEVDGLHHVTAITADIDANLEFYGRLLRLRLVWQGVNADDPEMRHIAYGDERGSPGSIVTFFDMPGVMRGRPGAGMVHRLLFRVASEKALDFWEHRLARAGVPSDRLADRLAFSDPEGLAFGSGGVGRASPRPGHLRHGAGGARDHGRGHDAPHCVHHPRG